MSTQLKQDHYKVAERHKEEEEQYLSGRGAQINTKNRFLKNNPAECQTAEAISLNGDLFYRRSLSTYLYYDVVEIELSPGKVLHH